MKRIVFLLPLCLLIGTASMAQGLCREIKVVVGGTTKGTSMVKRVVYPSSKFPLSTFVNRGWNYGENFQSHHRDNSFDEQKCNNKKRISISDFFPTDNSCPNDSVMYYQAYDLKNIQLTTIKLHTK